MGRLKRCLVSVMVVLVAVGGVSSAHGDSLKPPCSYKKASPNGQYLLVMIAPMPLELDVKPWDEEVAAKIREIRGAYTRSGLYRNDGSTEPLWTIDWYAHNVEIESDGVHLIRMGPWASSTDTEAFSFFANGELMPLGMGTRKNLSCWFPRSFTLKCSRWSVAR